MKNIIMWEKWHDPYGSDIKETEWPGYNVKNILNDAENNSGYIDIDFLKPMFFQEAESAGIKHIATPMGIVPLTEDSIPSKVFNFWVAHTNFDITPKVKTIVENTAGVETLDIFTRYRMRIAIGKAFNDSIILREINTKLEATMTEK